MQKSKDAGVQKFLTELKAFDSDRYKIVTQARALVFAAYPAVSERIMYGGIMFTLEKDIGGLFVSKNHVSFEFSNGAAFKDPEGLLEGVGKFRRHLKLKNSTDVKAKEVAFFVGQVTVK